MTTRTKKSIMADIKATAGEIKRTLNSSSDEMSRLRVQLNEATVAHRRSIQPKVAELNAKRDGLLAELKATEKPAPVVHPEVAYIIKALCAGVDWSGKWQQTWAREDGAYAIISKSSGTCWAGMGMKARYVPTQHVLICTEKGKGLRGTTLMDAIKIAEVEGRLTEEKRNQWQHDVVKLI